VGITAGSREVPGRIACDRRHTYGIIINVKGEGKFHLRTGHEGSEGE